MNLAFAGIAAIIFGAGITLMVARDLFRVVAGAVLTSNAVNLLILLLSRNPPAGELDVLGREVTADPLAQALALTATVITFAIAAFLLALTMRVYATHRTIDMGDLAEAEAEEEERIEREKEEV